MTPEAIQDLCKWIDVNLFDGGKFVGLMKRGAWYQPKAQGYTDDVMEAGRFTREEAAKHEYPRNRVPLKNEEPVTIHEFPTPDYTQPALAMKVLKVCKEMCGCVKLSTALTGMQSVFTGEKEHIIYGLAETLELAILLFAKKLFSK